ncbi:MAG: type VI secretion system membrane subunit TssM [Alcanivorax sp.]|nr:type VI secretion system membrane subunit TssM [Alcanivorax sp.]
MPNGKVLQMLKGLLLSRFGSSAIGLIAVIALIWYAGPYVGLADRSLRIWVIVGLIGLFVLAFGVRFLLARRRGAALQAQISGQGQAAEIDSIREKMDEAISALKSSQLGGGYRGSAALYALPWYMVIGPSAAGKSTMLRNSGLHFPYADADDLHFRGVGGTRNCDWWFSDEAVLLDTAGRYTTEDEDRDEWYAFLDMLRGQRKRAPINGVLVAISVADLLTADSDALERHVKIIRERINELMERLGLVFPVFIVFTKSDLIPGFEEFFEDLSDSERGQLWGAYLLEQNENGPAPAEAFEQHMNQMYGRLCELRLRKLSMQRKLDRKAALYAFPDQFRAATEKLSECINMLFRDNPYQETPQFAGAYFTSGTQEGTPLTRLVGNLRQAFGFDERELPPRASAPKPYFINRLFTEVVIPLQSFVRGNRRRMLWDRGLKTGAVAAGLLLVVGTLLTLSASYGANRLLLNQGVAVSERVGQAFSDDRYDTLDRYQVLADAFDHYQQLKAYEDDLPWRFRFGVYNGHHQMPVMEELIEAAMTRFYRQPAFHSLELALENMERGWDAADSQGQEAMRDEYYASLKTYLMISRAPLRMETDVAVPVLNKLWLDRLGMKSEPTFRDALKDESHALHGLADFYLARTAQREQRWNARQELITQSRDQLQSPPDARQMYAQVISRGANEVQPFGIEQMLDRNARNIIGASNQIPGVYTRDGWTRFVSPQIDTRIEAATRGDWVLTGRYSPSEDEANGGDLIDRELARELREEMRDLYFEDYAKAWLTFLGDVRVHRFDSLQDGVGHLDQLSRSGGPIGQLMAAVSRNLSLHEPTGPGDAALDALGDRRATLAGLDERTTELRRFARPAEDRSVSEMVHQYLTILSALKTDMERLALAVNVDSEAEVYAASILGRGGSETELYRSWVTISSLLATVDPTTREALRPLLEGAVRESWRNVLLAARSSLGQQWQREVANTFEERLQSRFPFNARGQDATLEDMSDFFRPGDGRFWGFVNESMDAFVEQTRRGWQERTWLDQGLGLSQRFLGTLASSQVITDSLFGRGGRRPELSFYLYPVPARGVTEIMLESNGQAYRYRNGPQEWRRFTWPGEQDLIGARVAGIAGRGQIRDEIRADGHWALFRLLNQATISRDSGSDLLLQWELSGGMSDPLLVRYRLRADRQSNLFRNRILNTFRVPADIFGNLMPIAGTVMEGR